MTAELFPIMFIRPERRAGVGGLKAGFGLRHAAGEQVAVGANDFDRFERQVRSSGRGI